MSEKKQSRQHSHDLLIDAAPEVVWQAITDPEQLVHWFPTEAEVEEGAGGRILYQWKDSWKIACSIQEWSPPHHLRTTWGESGWSSEKAAPLAVDWHLQGEGGRTRLRLVHSGFGATANWDEEYDGTRRGWNFELLSLKHYLEHHRNSKRESFWVRQATVLPAENVWLGLVGSNGVVQFSDPRAAKPGQDLSIRLAGTPPISGTLLTYTPPQELSCVVDSWNKGLLRLGYETGQGNPESQAWVSLWDSPPERAQFLRDALGTALRQASA